MTHRITHLTSVHPRYDTRIFHKMCASLASQDHEVTLVVADGKGAEVKNGVRIVDVGASKGRFDRIRNAPKRVFAKAAALKADLYHVHDPELIPTGLKLKRLGYRVIFDSHEDVPKQLLGKPYLNKPALWVIAKTFSAYEAWACSKLDGIVAATPFIRDKFLSINANTVDINNFPLLGELASDVPWENKQPEVCYVGGIGKIRGIQEVCAAMGRVQSGARLNLVGLFGDPILEQSVQTMPGWRQVNAYGYVDRTGVRDVLGRSMAGVVTFLPAPNHIDAQPNKMFEYMSAGIPVIASDFPLWREIIAGNGCGLLVDPLNPAAIAQAIDYLVSNPAEAQRKGANGRKAVNERYNWTIEEQKLFAFYENTLSQPVK
jgi:glycosyltransferase involved in cell wall biosynthesis